MAHAGKLFPVAFRRDLCLNVIDKRYYLARSWRLSFQGIFGSWGSTLIDQPFLNAHEYDSTPDTLWGWELPWTFYNGRTFKVDIWAETRPGFDYAIVAEVIDSTLGFLGRFQRLVLNTDRYNQLNLVAGFDPPPHGAVFSAFGPASQIFLLPMQWAEYNAMNP